MRVFEHEESGTRFVLSQTGTAIPAEGWVELVGKVAAEHVRKLEAEREAVRERMLEDAAKDVELALKRADARKRALGKLKTLGLTDEEIEAL